MGGRCFVTEMRYENKPTAFTHFFFFKILNEGTMFYKKWPRLSSIEIQS